MWQSFGLGPGNDAARSSTTAAGGERAVLPVVGLAGEIDPLSPTAHVRVETGAGMVGTGGVLFTLMVTVLLADRPPLSVTRKRATNVPADVYVNDGIRRERVVGAVAVEVPRVAQRPAFGIGRAAARELHDERRLAAGRSSPTPPHSAAGCPTRT